MTTTTTTTRCLEYGCDSPVATVFFDGCWQPLTAVGGSPVCKHHLVNGPERDPFGYRIDQFGRAYGPNDPRCGKDPFTGERC